LVAAISLALAESGSNPATLVNLRLAASLTTFCPMVALLGAKRPQHHAWQLIVLSLWMVLVLPVAEAHFAGRGAAARMHDARGWFLLVLIVIGVANYTATRFWPSCWLVAVGQVMLLADQLPILRHTTSLTERLAGVVCLGLAVALVRIGWPGRVVRSEATADRIWIDFRDWFGMLWSLRIAQRLNQSAAGRGEIVRIGWTGLEPHDENGDPSTASVLGYEERMCRLLLRFVSRDWLQRRAQKAGDKRA